MIQFHNLNISMHEIGDINKDDHNQPSPNKKKNALILYNCLTMDGECMVAKTCNSKELRCMKAINKYLAYKLSMRSSQNQVAKHNLNQRIQQ